MVMRSACPLSFWPSDTVHSINQTAYSGQEGTGRWAGTDPWRQIQSLASWYHTACCRTLVLSICWVWAWGNLHWAMRVDIWVDRAWIPTSGNWQISGRSSSQKCQKCSLANWGIFCYSGVMVPLSWGTGESVYLCPQTYIFSCFQPVCQSSASSVLMLMPPR